MVQPLVSILIPAFNAGEWLAEAVQSAIDQTWDNKEIVIVDDGSVDNTLGIAKGFEGPKVRVITQPNMGASAARNKAYSLAQGDFIQWLDADDVLDVRKVELQMRAALLDNDPMLLYSGSWGRFYYRKEKAEFAPTKLWADSSPVDWLVNKMQLGLHMQPDVWLVSRPLTDAAGPWDESLWRDNDGEYFCRVVAASSGIRFVKEAISYYRSSGNTSISHIGSSNKKIESLHRSLTLHAKYLRSLEDSPRTRQACVAYFATWQNYFCADRPDLLVNLRELSKQMGFELPAPTLRTKYRAIERMAGWRAARRVQFLLPSLRTNISREWDKILYKFQERPK